MPFGPFLALGGVVAVLAGDPLVDAYLGTFGVTDAAKSARPPARPLKPRPTGVEHSDQHVAPRHVPRTSTGLDIEPGSIAAAKVTVNGHIAVDQAAVAPLEPNVVRDGEVGDVDALAEALKDLFREHKDLGKKVRVGIANAADRRPAARPAADRERQGARDRRPLPGAAEELPMPLDQAVLDFQDARHRSRRPTARASASSSSPPAATWSSSRSPPSAPPACKLEGIDLSAFAMIRALGAGAPSRRSTSRVGGLTNLAIADERGCSFTRVAPTGLESMAAELAERCALPLHEAREWLTPRRPARRRPSSSTATPRPPRWPAPSWTRASASSAATCASPSTSISPPAAPRSQRVVLTGPAARVPSFAGGPRA